MAVVQAVDRRVAKYYGSWGLAGVLGDVGIECLPGTARLLL